MRTIYVSPEFPLNRRMRKDIRRGKLQVVREGGERSSLGGGIPSGKRRAFRTTGSPLVCMADNGAEVGEGGGGGNGNKEDSEKIPSTLYKYAPPCLKRIEEVIIDNAIYFSSPLNFNDPYDCRVIPDMATQEKVEEIIQKADEFNKAHNRHWENIPEEVKRQRKEKLCADPDFANKEAARFSEYYLRKTNLGICCLCESGNNVVMWANYAQNHTGVCYEFNTDMHAASYPNVVGGRKCFPFIYLRKVRYEDSCLIYKWSDLENFSDIFVVKAKEWRYEQEWRAHMPDSRILDDYTGKHVFPLEMVKCMGGGMAHGMDKRLLSGVILGSCMEDKVRQEVIKMAKSENIEIKCARLKTFEYGFDIVPYNEVAK